MIRSMFSGVSGLRVHQTKMDVIGNNIANVNTIGFKSSSVNFSDIFYQTTQSASGPNASTGTAGRNAMQIGLGANVASITTSITSSGAAMRTDNPFDVMINGDGFFIVNYGGTNYFTKAGSFNVDADGNLCTATGALVMGWQVDPNDPTKTVPETVSPLRIMSPENLYAAPEATTAAYLKGNIDISDTQLTSETGRIVNLTFYDNMGQEYTAKMRIWQSEEATNEYETAITDILDENGNSIFVTKEVDADGTVRYASSSITSFTFGGIDFSNIDVNETDGTVSIDMTDRPKITFDGSTGEFISVGDGDAENPETKLSLVINADPSPFKQIDIDFSSLTMYKTSGSNVQAYKGDLNGVGKGKKVGDMTGVSIDTAGRIYGKYDNGDSILLGQIALATFANPAGLEAVGNNMFAATQNSGEFDGIGQDPTEGGGSLTTGVLEMSNVDLSQEFTDMITTQRGFQANSRIITTSDSMLEELINLKR